MHRRDLLAMAGGGLLAATAGSAAAHQLDSYRWNRRLLVVFAPLRTDPRLSVQRGWLASAADGLAERDMTVIEVVRNAVSIDGQRSLEMNADHLRQDHRVTNVEFAAILIGKDGGEKLRRDAAIPVEDLFALIDSMPMRQHEMQQDGKKI